MGLREQTGTFWALGLNLNFEEWSPAGHGSNEMKSCLRTLITFDRSLVCIFCLQHRQSHRNRSFQHTAYTAFWTAVLPWDCETDHPARRWQVKVTPSLFPAFSFTSLFSTDVCCVSFTVPTLSVLQLPEGNLDFAPQSLWSFWRQILGLIEVNSKTLTTFNTKRFQSCFSAYLQTSTLNCFEGKKSSYCSAHHSV